MVVLELENEPVVITFKDGDKEVPVEVRFEDGELRVYKNTEQSLRVKSFETWMPQTEGV